MSTLRLRHYRKKYIAHRVLVDNKAQYFIALFVVDSFSFVKMKIRSVVSMSVADYWKIYFIVFKNKQEQNICFS
jgi:hypothetical protein